MGWLSWLSRPPSRPSPGPTEDGVYGALPKRAVWNLGPDPAGDPQKFLPQPGGINFQLVEWTWDDVLRSVALINTPEGLMGFSFGFDLSDGTAKDGYQESSLADVRSGKPGKLIEWTIPKGHPRRLVYFVSLGELTTRLARFLERCGGLPSTEFAAIKENSAFPAEIVFLRGRIVPEAGLFTARCKVFLGSQFGEGDDRYAEFFMNINSVTKMLWLSHKAHQYQLPILRWITGQVAIGGEKRT